MKKKKKKQRSDTLDKLTRAFELPVEMLESNFRMIVSGNSDVYIENHEGIQKYTQKEVRIKVPSFVIVLRGKDMVLRAMGKENVIVYGSVADISLEPERPAL